MTDEQKRASLGAMEDQVWASLRPHWRDITRITEGGPDSERDEKLILLVMVAVAGMLHTREYDANTEAGE